MSYRDKSWLNSIFLNPRVYTQLKGSTLFFDFIDFKPRSNQFSDWNVYEDRTALTTKQLSSFHLRRTSQNLRDLPEDVSTCSWIRVYSCFWLCTPDGNVRWKLPLSFFGLGSRNFIQNSDKDIRILFNIWCLLDATYIVNDRWVLINRSQTPWLTSVRSKFSLKSYSDLQCHSMRFSYFEIEKTLFFVAHYLFLSSSSPLLDIWDLRDLSFRNHMFTWSVSIFCLRWLTFSSKSDSSSHWFLNIRLCS